MHATLRSIFRLASASASAFAFAFALALGASSGVAAAPRCLTDCTPRVGIVSAFGEEAAILVAQTKAARTHVVNGNRFTTGLLRGNRVVIVLSGVSMINASMTTQLMLDHFRVERLVMSGISGGVNPAHKVGDVMIPDRWIMPMEVYWHHDASVPAPCGTPGDVACLGLRLASRDGRPLPSFVAPAGAGASGASTASAATGLFMRENHVMSRTAAPGGDWVFDYVVDPEMLAVARTIRPALQRCGPKATRGNGAPDPKLCVQAQPEIVIGGRGVSGTAFLANPAYRTYLFEQAGAQTVDMETAALAHVARANGVPYIAFRSLSDLAGAEAFNADVGALFSSGLAESNESAVTLAFLDAWARRRPTHRP